MIQLSPQVGVAMKRVAAAALTALLTAAAEECFREAVKTLQQAQPSNDTDGIGHRIIDVTDWSHNIGY